ncbi:hypothetical protein [Spirosoma spitsbergense]|uniref:hypothetical protein n=1 Tax=Spirosoma spitsbergense TaxID=431554 RepID=UPI0012F7A958|nr:hypothetical protein [Spirosoma spitsbergense]
MESPQKYFEDLPDLRIKRSQLNNFQGVIVVFLIKSYYSYGECLGEPKPIGFRTGQSGGEIERNNCYPSANQGIDIERVYRYRTGVPGLI